MNETMVSCRSSLGYLRTAIPIHHSTKSMCLLEKDRAFERLALNTVAFLEDIVISIQRAIVAKGRYQDAPTGTCFQPLGDLQERHSYPAPW